METGRFPIETSDGIVDFHSLRATYIIRLAEVATVKVTAALVRHSKPTLRFKAYAKIEQDEKLERGGKCSGPRFVTMPEQ
ncbi:MAG: hypothetical protein U0794_12100 [Isosphaeraceae bacterium]